MKTMMTLMPLMMMMMTMTKMMMIMMMMLTQRAQQWGVNQWGPWRGVSLTFGGAAVYLQGYESMSVDHWMDAMMRSLWMNL